MSRLPALNVTVPDLLCGYGKKPGLVFQAYFIVILFFTEVYFRVAPFDVGLPTFPWYEWPI